MDKIPESKDILRDLLYSCPRMTTEIKRKMIEELGMRKHVDYGVYMVTE